MTGIFLLLVSQRVIRRWNQTGQKLAGEPDISKDFLLKHGQGLWICVLSTYISAAFQIRRRCMKGRGSYALSALSIALCLIAITFKLNFTIHDAPELLTGLPEYILRPIGKLGLLAQARSIHFMTAALIGYVLFGGQSGTQPEGSSVVESGEIGMSTCHVSSIF
jgi:ethanolaminephosphotransferase